MQKLKNILTAGVFCLIIFGAAIWHIILPDAQISREERRRLTQKPSLTVQTLMSGKYSENLEKYLLDQFPARTDLRRLNAFLRLDILRQGDYQGIRFKGGQLVKPENRLDEAQISYAADRVSGICEKYLGGSRIFYSVIPDKNYYAAQEYGYPSFDYARILELFDVPGEYVDLFSEFLLDDYYRTDTHLRQDRIEAAVLKLAKGLGTADGLTPQDRQPHTLSPFYGVYYGQAAGRGGADDIVYLTSKATDAAVMTGTDFEGELPVYTLDRFSGGDSYDIFAGGAQAVLTIESPLAKTERELILFRDSFGSSFAPLLAEAYSKITLVDTRYVSTELLSELVDFHGQDVLFLYSAPLINSGRVLK